MDNQKLSIKQKQTRKYYLESDVVDKKKNIINFDRFLNRKNMWKDIFIILSFFTLFLIIGINEKNLILPNDGLGLLQHRNIWLFLLINILVSILFYLIFKYLKKNLSQESWDNLKNEFEKISETVAAKILGRLLTIIGFCCFAGNSLQNANIINHLSFDYWDSIHYPISYIISRGYKLYLFVFFIPTILIYVAVLIKSVSKILEIPEEKMNEYPIENYEQLNTLCSFGLDILLLISVSFMILAGNVYTIHNRWDITTLTSMAISLISSIIFLGMYLLLIRNYRVSIMKYKQKNIAQIDYELAKINKYIIDPQTKPNKKLDVFIKKGKYLWKIKKKINNISCFPYKIKGFFVSISPITPVLLKIMIQFLNTFFRLGKFITIL